MYENDIFYGPLPELLRMKDGSKVKTAADWEKRKAEYLSEVIDIEYGGMPPKPEYFRLDHVCQGFGTGFDTYRITAGPEKNPITFVLHIYYPGNIDDKNNHDRYPVILTGDGCWLDCDRAVLEEAHSRGYAVANFDRTELAPDMYNTDRDLGIYPLYPDCEFSAVSAWAWAYMRCVDALCMLEHIDTDHIAVSGHSRGGKAVLLAGALDERITYTNPNCSGTHGCGCYRYVSHDMTDEGDTRSEPLCYQCAIGCGLALQHLPACAVLQDNGHSREGLLGLCIYGLERGGIELRVGYVRRLPGLILAAAVLIRIQNYAGATGVDYNHGTRPAAVVVIVCIRRRRSVTGVDHDAVAIGGRRCIYGAAANAVYYALGRRGYGRRNDRRTALAGCGQRRRRAGRRRRRDISVTTVAVAGIIDLWDIGFRRGNANACGEPCLVQGI